MKILDGEFMEMHLTTLLALMKATEAIIDMNKRITKLEEERDHERNSCDT